MSARTLPFALPSIGREEIDEVTDALRSGWITTGPKVRTFETEFARYIGVPYALAVCSGTAALHLALEAAGVKAGDEVIVPAYTFTATAEAAAYLGARPVFVDIDADTFTLLPREVEKAVGPKTKAVIPVHFGGQACDMDPIREVCAGKGIAVIEDAAHSLPCTYKGVPAGRLGDAAAFSFYATKPLATAEGGMVTTVSDSMAARIKTMRLHGIDRDAFDRYTSSRPKWYYEVVEAGFKYNMADINAAIGIHQLRKTEQFHRVRTSIAERYHRAFVDLPLKVPRAVRPRDVHSYHLYVIQLDLDRLTIDRNGFIEKMAEEGIGTSVHFIPLHLHPYWRDRLGYKPEDFPVSLDCYRRVVSLPIYPGMTDEDVERVIAAVTGILKRHSRGGGRSASA